MNHQELVSSEKVKSMRLKKLNILTKKTARAPFTLSENEKEYSLFLILPGIEKKDVFVDVKKNKNELSVYVAKKNQMCHDAAFWVFAVPADGLLGRLTTRLGHCGLEISIPKALALQVA